MPIRPDDRGRRGAAYTLLTPANRYASRLPGMPGSTVFKLVTPRRAPARFAQYLIVVGEDALDLCVGPGFEHFFLGLGGAAAAASRAGGEALSLGDGCFAYFGSSVEIDLTAEPGTRLIWVKRRYEPVAELEPPQQQSGELARVEAAATAVPGLDRRELIDPADPAFDFNMSHMEFEPGVELAQIEIHDEEHGLYMTSGSGTYHLDGEEFEVQRDDFIYMAPYCPQGFRAGASGASYLLYKDVYRDGF